MYGSLAEAIEREMELKVANSKASLEESHSRLVGRTADSAKVRLRGEVCGGEDLVADMLRSERHRRRRRQENLLFTIGFCSPRMHESRWFCVDGVENFQTDDTNTQKPIVVFATSTNVRRFHASKPHHACPALRWSNSKG